MFFVLTLIAMFALLLLSCFFSSSETAMLALNRHKIQSAANNGDRIALRINRLLDRSDLLLATILLGNNFVNILLSSLVTLLTIRFWGDALIPLSSLLLTLVILIFAEITPKNYALQNTYRLARFISYGLRLWVLLLRPISAFIIRFSDYLLALLGKQEAISKDQYEIEDLRSVVTDPRTILAGKHRNILLSILDINNLVAEDAMTPKSEIIGLDVSALTTKNFDEIRLLGHSEIPVYAGHIEQLKGTIRIGKLISLIENNIASLSDTLETHLKPAYFVPESTPLLTLFMQLRQRNESICFVVDEYGALQGMITLSDVLDEITGEIKSQDISIHYDGKGQRIYLIDGSTNVRAINNHLKWRLPTDKGVTLHGLIMEKLESLPEGNVSLKIGDYLVQTTHIEDGFVTKAQVYEIGIDNEQ